MSKTVTVRVTYNGKDITPFFASELMAKVMDRLAQDMLEVAKVPPMRGVFAPVRTRIVARQSCLWRHSFDWRNRKRGHPVHRA